MKKDAITANRFFREHGQALKLELQAGATGLDRIIGEATINRPGLALAGFTKHFALQRVQVIGAAESSYVRSLDREERVRRFRELCSFRIPCVVVTRSINPDPLLKEAANRASVPVFKCPLVTKKFINQATLALEIMFAPRGVEIGSMVDILGIGVIIRGESGIGKSECVLELIERGYSLVADDVTRVVLMDGKDIIGSSDSTTLSLMEVRGIGIINVASMFGVKAIRTNKRVDLVVTLKAWNEVRDIDRLGMESEYETILGIKVPHITIPVRPGRNLARLVEVAAFHTKLKLAGINPARELNDRIMAKMRKEPDL